MSFGATPTTSGESATTNSSAPAPGAGLFGAPSSSSTPKHAFGQGTVFGQGTTSAFGQSGGFGQPSGGSTKPSSIFGEAGSSAPAGGGLFGNAQSKPSPFASEANKADSSGNSSMPGGSSAAPSIFGTQQQQPDAATGQQPAPAAGMFASTGNSLFGNKNPADTTAPGLSTPSKPAFAIMSTIPAGAPSNLVKSATTNAASKQAAGLSTPVKPTLSVMSTTPAGAPPANMMKSATTNAAFKQGNSSTAQPSSASSLFGASPAAGNTSSSGSLFAKPAANSASSPFGQLGANSSGAAAGSSGTAGNTSSSSPFASLLSKPASTTTTSAEETPAASTSASAPSAPKMTTGSSLFAGLSNAGASTEKPSASPFAAAASSSSNAPQSATAAPASGGAGSKPPAAAPSSLGGGLFGAKPATETDTKEQDKAKNAAESSAQQGSTNPLGASTSGPTSQLPRLKNKTMEDIITRWASDLSKYQKEFKEQATVVSQWDRNLVENGEKIQKLYLDTFEAERASNEIERQLVTVESQQDELEAWLDRYESEVQDMFAKQLGPGEQLSGPDQERERTYKLAEKLTQQLDEKSRDLSKMVKEINDISGTLSKGVKAEDPLSQIVRVLNDHLTQLQWIDSNAAVLTAKISAAHKAGSVLNSNHARLDSDAAESFYKSYMGRR